MSRRRWLIESSTNNDWEVIGSIDAASPEEAAFAAGGWADAKGHKLRAISWEQASAKDKEAAEYEDDMRFRQWQAYGGRGTVEYAAGCTPSIARPRSRSSTPGSPARELRLKVTGESMSE